MSNQNRHLKLDAIRGLSALAIVIAHLPDLDHHVLTPEDNFWYLYIRSIGWLGVDIFFVLSGFLISGMLFKNLDQNGHIQIRRFYYRRFFRIFPPLYVLILLTYTFQGLLTNMPLSKVLK